MPSRTHSNAIKFFIALMIVAGFLLPYKLFLNVGRTPIDISSGSGKVSRLPDLYFVILQEPILNEYRLAIVAEFSQEIVEALTYKRTQFEIESDLAKRLPSTIILWDLAETNGYKFCLPQEGMELVISQVESSLKSGETTEAFRVRYSVDTAPENKNLQQISLRVKRNVSKDFYYESDCDVLRIKSYGLVLHILPFVGTIAGVLTSLFIFSITKKILLPRK